ncbi:MAG: helix-turn-helix domain-containing protein, partial [bacterium]
DIRIISATNKDLRDEVEKGNFREDLYYRLSVFPIRIPPLRERPEDIPVLVDYFIEKLNKEYKKNVKRPDNKIMRELSKKEWKGNVRELRNFTARYILSSGDVSMTTDGGFSSKGDSSDVVSFKIGELSLKDMEKKVIKTTLKYTGGNKKETAELLDVSQRTIYRKLTDEDV